MNDDEMVVADDFGDLDDIGEQEWREVDPDAPHPDGEVLDPPHGLG